MNKLTKAFNELGLAGLNRELFKENGRLKRENTRLKKLAESWMNDCDKLREKYEPFVMVEQVDINGNGEG